MPHRIAMFNHKGGVGKTLSSYHLGWKLTEKGHRVLLVDGDSQVNLTALALGAERFDSYYDDENTSNKNIKDGIAPVFEGRPESIESFECPKALGNELLYVLPGHAELSAYEGQLSLAQETGGTLSVLRNLPGALTALISSIENRYDIEYTIIDLNPGLGAINQNLFLTADSFIVPTNPDPFSKMAVKTLAEQVVKWAAWKARSEAIYVDSLYPLSSGVPRFLGTLTSRFNKHSSRAAARFDERIRDIDKTVSDVMVPRLAGADMLFADDLYTQAYQRFVDMGPGQPTSRFCLARIPDFQSLAPIGSNNDMPVFRLSERELKGASLGGSSLATAKTNVSQFNVIFEKMSDKIRYILTNE